MKRFSVVLCFLFAVLLVFNLGCEPDPVNQFTDERDGQTYKTIEIGTQTWMAENLKYLPAVSPASVGSRTEPYYYVYDYQGITVSEAKATANFSTYGALYNWPAALTACPPGWHLPSDAEWTTLTDFLGDNAGGKMKSISSLWHSPNTDATNESGWSGLPGGYRDHGGGNFRILGSGGTWWSDSKHDAVHAWFRVLGYDHGGVNRGNYDKGHGFSVRCLMD